ncbi:auxin efflux carrier [Lactarius deliciosus]|nr:auxin efflux carrier [Lactarius deliciosus]
MQSLAGTFTTTEATPIWPLFQTVCSSITQVILVTISGYYLSRRGLLDKTTQKQLNIINVNFFTPCLLFSKVAFSLSPDKLRELWVIPIFFALVSGVSLVVAWLLGSLFRLDRTHRNFAMAAAMIMNSNSLPVALLQSLAVTVPGLQWGQDDTLDAIVGRAITYLLLCGTMGQFLRWSYGVHFLSKAVPPDEIGSLSEDTEECEGPRRDAVLEVYRDTGSQDNYLITAQTTTSQGRPQSCYRSVRTDIRGPTQASQSFPGSLHTRPPSDTDGETASASDSYLGLLEDDAPRPAWSRPPLTFVQRTVRTGRSIWRKVTGFMTPPLWASVLSLVVALNQPLQNVLGVQLRPIRYAIAQAGDCSIPLTLVVLGAYFHRPPDKSKLPSSGPNGQQQASLVDSFRRLFRIGGWKEHRGTPLHAARAQNRAEGMTVFVSILARMVIAPALLLPLVVFGQLQGYPHVFRDPVFILSLVLLLASPPALTLAQITQCTSDAFERLISRTIFWSYCLVAPPAMVGYALIAMLITRLNPTCLFRVKFDAVLYVGPTSGSFRLNYIHRASSLVKHRGVRGVDIQYCKGGPDRGSVTRAGGGGVNPKALKKFTFLATGRLIR